MSLTGHNFIGATATPGAAAAFTATEATSGAALPVEFREASIAQVDEAATIAAAAAPAYAATTAEQRATFLEAIATEIEALGEPLLERAAAETALPAATRLTGERGRTCGQLRLFADVIREGSWVDARVDQAIPDRAPMPKPDVRSMLRPLGPVAVFGASNFPLAFSTAGGDTASALAAGCPVIVKAHPAHPGTAEYVAQAILKAAADTGMPDGVFSLIHGGIEIGGALVTHPAITAVGFTGSLRGGRALFDLAAARPNPIPVYAEMGSINPVFILPGALSARREQLAAGLAGSITMGVGQFCTSPGLVLTEAGADADSFAAATAAALNESADGTMLTAGIASAFEAGVATLASKTERLTADGQAALFRTDATTYEADEALAEEVFGPASLLVTGSRDELLSIAANLDGHLTATIHGTEADLENAAALIAILERKVGRIVINGFPTGVEVCDSMVHGGPYPATTDARSTSVGTGAILRFARPVCYQGFPAALLPPELQDGNPTGIRRIENSGPS